MSSKSLFFNLKLLFPPFIPFSFMEVIFHVSVWLSPFAVHQKLSWHCLLIGYVLACVLSRFNCVWLCATTWTAACQAPLSMGFSREEYWSRLPCPPPGDLSNPGIESVTLTSLVLVGEFFSTSATWLEYVSSDLCLHGTCGCDLTEK